MRSNEAPLPRTYIVCDKLESHNVLRMVLVCPGEGRDVPREGNLTGSYAMPLPVRRHLRSCIARHAQSTFRQNLGAVLLKCLYLICIIV
jgi:hypothetical protein